MLRGSTLQELEVAVSLAGAERHWHVGAVGKSVPCMRVGFLPVYRAGHVGTCRVRLRLMTLLGSVVDCF